MREKCRYCENKRKEGVEWYDDNYCSGKCKKLDGGTIYPVAEQVKASGVKASLSDYVLDYPKNLGERDRRGQRIKGRTPKRYCRRYEPERLNWDEPMADDQLKQAGFRANRKPLPGDWDYEEQINAIVEEETKQPNEKQPNDWDLFRARARELNIQTHGKKREEIEAEIKENENGGK